MLGCLEGEEGGHVVYEIVLVSWSLDIKVFVLFTVHALITQVSDSVKL